MEDRYGPDFFAGVEATARDGAQRILPLVLDLLRPRSVVDVGCGPGVWLAEAHGLGIDDYLGVDGYTPADALRIERERFVLHDLTTPLRLNRRFDLVLCLEVAEHLEPEAADTIVDSLVGLGPAVLFSAAVPDQSGDHHVNEQWPEYWVERFAARGLVAVDAVRPVIWRDSRVPWWYRQNTLLFCSPELIEANSELKRALEGTRGEQLAVVQPVLLRWMAHQRDLLAAELARERGLREALGVARGAAGRAIRRRLRSLSRAA